jgi:hypothetical protein
MRVRWVMIMLIAVITATTVSCTSSRPDLTTAKTNCATVGRELGAAPGTQAVWIRKIATAAPTGVLALDSGMRGLAQAIRGTDVARTDRAFSQVQTVCSRLGLWQVYH